MAVSPLLKLCIQKICNVIIPNVIASQDKSFSLPSELVSNVIQYLSSHGLITSEILHLFDNVHVQEMDLSLPLTQVTSNIDDSILEVVQQHTELTILDLSRCFKITSGAVNRLLEGLTNLRSLNLTRCKKVDNNALAHINRLTGLVELKLGGTIITDATVPKICEISNLRILNLDGTRITDASIQQISEHLPSLISLSIGHTRGIGAMRGMTDESCQYLSKLSRLTSLDLTLSNTSDAVQHLSTLVDLRELILSMNAAVTDEGAAVLSHLTNLVVLDLSRTSITSAGLIHLKNLTDLQTLKLDCDDVGDEGIEHISGLHKLKSLQVAYTQISTGSADLLKNLPQLQLLKASYCQNFGDDAVQSLAEGCKTLISLDLGSPAITDRSIEYLTTLSNLVSLSLWETSITSAAMQPLKHYGKLHPLDVRMNTTAGTYIFKEEIYV